MKKESKRTIHLNDQTYYNKQLRLAKRDRWEREARRLVLRLETGARRKTLNYLGG